MKKRTWYVEVDGLRMTYTNYLDALTAFTAAAGAHVFLCRGDGTCLACKPDSKE